MSIFNKGKYDMSYPEPPDKAKIVQEVILNRRSVRKFNNEKISPKDLGDLIEAGIYAPSGSNSQNQRFLILNDKREISDFTLNRYRLSNIKHNWMGDASIIIIVFADTSKGAQGKLWKNLSIQNVAASIQNILLLATAKGIGSCWISLWSEMDNTDHGKKPWKNILSNYQIPSTYQPYGMILLGYPQHYNKKGYPEGCTQHGKQLVQRKHLDFYLIKKC